MNYCGNKANVIPKAAEAKKQRILAWFDKKDTSKNKN
jgi:hypothetical protein